MFDVGSYIVYGVNGVCRVESVGKLDIAGIPADKDYYTLSPVYSSSKMYTPIDNNLVKMRYICSKEEAKKFLDDLDDVEAVWDDSDKVREEMYKEAIKSCDLVEMAKILKTLNKIKVERMANGKKVTNSDERYFNSACDKVSGELAIALELDKDEVTKIVTEKIEK